MLFLITERSWKFRFIKPQNKILKTLMAILWKKLENIKTILKKYVQNANSDWLINRLTKVILAKSKINYFAYLFKCSI